jgi:peptidoglycan/LPS O-acetylase OafA/YrhL
MADNPFKPPDARLRDPQPGPGSPLRAILAGLLVDLGGSMLVGIALSLFYAASLASSGLSQAQVDEAMKNVAPTSGVAIVGIVLGALCSVAGGYVCARIARRDEYRTGGIMAALSAFFSLLMGGDGTPGDLAFLLTLCTIACVLLGVKYGREANRRQAAPREGARP